MLRASGAHAAFVAADVTQDADAMTAATVAHFGQLDILVDNAGVFYPADALTTPFDAWLRAVDVIYSTVPFIAAAPPVRSWSPKGRAGASLAFRR